MPSRSIIHFGLYCTTALVYNFARFYTMMTYPLIATNFHASSTALGFGSALYSVVVTILSPFMGHLSDVMHPPHLVRMSITLAVVGTVCLMFAPSMLWVYASMLVMGLSSSLFWPIIQSSVGIESPPGKEAHRITSFSISWGVGKAIGCLFAGYIYDAVGLVYSLLFLAILSATGLFTYPLMDPKKARARNFSQLNDDEDVQMEETSKEKKESAENTPKEGTEQKKQSETDPAFVEVSGVMVPLEPMIKYNNALHLPLAWISNFLFYGISNTVASLYITMIKHNDIKIEGFVDTNSFLGLWSCILYILQLTVFIVCATTSAWQYKKSLIYLCEALEFAGLIVLSNSTNPYIILGMAVLMGAGPGLSVVISLTYSLRISESEKGKNTGYNEAIINLGSFLMPIISGFLSDLTGNLSAPYYFVAFLCVLAFIIQETSLRVREKGIRSKYITEPYVTLCKESAIEPKDSLTVGEMQTEILAMLHTRQHSNKEITDQAE
eukprot:TRINITY_DN4946_c0_g1_i1.p1 TRINITY_DN4946_c0_g1~~TRINITY_DN4946_c0_g1_i1.p1  ORF type:complete len:495 (-),score=128.12 TRINITY_DN4946_c0_g1_i1:56-1540(-)